MVHFRIDLKYNIQKKLIRYREKLNNLNFLIEVVTKLDNKFQILTIEIYYKNPNNKA